MRVVFLQLINRMKSISQIKENLQGHTGRLAKLVLACRNADFLSRLFRTGQGNMTDGNEGFASG